MREIKFRGRWQTTSGKYEWEYGVPYTSWEGQTAILFQSVRGDEDYFRCLSMSAREVDPDTIGQFTGLHDRTGKEIYEGDVVFWVASDIRGRGKGMQGAIIWDALTMSWAILNDKPTSDGRPMIISRPFDKKHLEIVGNIIDNPELMEKANGN